MRPLSREGRGEVFFERIECFQSGRGIQSLFAPALDPCIPSPLTGEGQGEGGPIAHKRREHLTFSQESWVIQESYVSCVLLLQGFTYQFFRRALPQLRHLMS